MISFKEKIRRIKLPHSLRLFIKDLAIEAEITVYDENGYNPQVMSSKDYISFIQGKEEDHGPAEIS